MFGDRALHFSLLTGVLTYGGLGLLVFAALHDISFRTVPNGVSLALLGLGLAIHLLGGPLAGQGWSGLIWAGVIAAIVLAVTFVFWILGMMGGGDVKLLTAAAFFVPSTALAEAHLIMGTALAGGVLSMTYLLGGYLVKRPRGGRPAGLVARVSRCEQWRLSRSGPVPYATAIAVGGVIATLNV